jgi:hypothetical protein
MPQSPLPQVSNPDQGAVGRRPPSRAPARAVFPLRLKLPHELNALTLLLRATSQTLRQFGRQNLGDQLGGIQVLHTWDQTLGAHVHVYCLVPGGVLAEHGTRWRPTHPRVLLPVHALSTGFRGKFLDALHASPTMGPLVLPAEAETLATPEGFRRFIDKLYIGFLANRCKARALRQCRQLLDQPADPPARPLKRVAEWLWQWTGTDITGGPECDQGPLRRLPLPPLPPRPLSLPPIWDPS